MCAAWAISCGTTRRTFWGDHMTQVGEMVDVGVIQVEDVACPFDHESPKPPTVENRLIGVGSTLARRMKNQEGTHLYSRIKADYPVDPMPNPRDVSGHPFEGKKDVVTVYDDFATKGKLVGRYPVTCAAHHCIPAQESLKDSPLLAYMVKKSDTEDLKDKKYKGTIVWSDVGYDVNGSENGFFLPGSYAVGGGRGGLGIWAPTDDEDDDKPEDAADMVAAPDSDE